jgi:hypothetical protein
MTQQNQNRIKAIKKYLLQEKLSLQELLDDLVGVDHCNIAGAIQDIDNACGKLNTSIGNHNEFKKHFQC